MGIKCAVMTKTWFFVLYIDWGVMGDTFFS